MTILNALIKVMLLTVIFSCRPKPMELQKISAAGDSITVTSPKELLLKLFEGTSVAKLVGVDADSVDSILKSKPTGGESQSVEMALNIFLAKGSTQKAINLSWTHPHPQNNASLLATLVRQDDDGQVLVTLATVYKSGVLLWSISDSQADPAKVSVYFQKPAAVQAIKQSQAEDDRGSDTLKKPAHLSNGEYHISWLKINMAHKYGRPKPDTNVVIKIADRTVLNQNFDNRSEIEIKSGIDTPGAKEGDPVEIRVIDKASGKERFTCQFKLGKFGNRCGYDPTRINKKNRAYGGFKSRAWFPQFAEVSLNFFEKCKQRGSWYKFCDQSQIGFTCEFPKRKKRCTCTKEKEYQQEDPGGLTGYDRVKWRQCTDI